MYKEIDFSNIIAVSNRSLSRLPYLEQVERICSFHPKAFLLREKDLPEEEYLELAREVNKICVRHGVALIPHFYPEAAESLGLDVVHLPLWKLKTVREAENTRTAEDARAAEAASLDTDTAYLHFRIGVSVHSAEEAREAVRLGASYLTAGHVFLTDCKKGLPARGLDFLREVCEAVPVPVYGIGGIHLDAEQIGAVLRQGAAGVCIMSGMMRM